MGVIPVKPLHLALGRLAGVLGVSERVVLQREMLASVLSACSQAREVEGVVVVTADDTVADLAVRAGAQVVPDHVPPRGMNPAVVIGCAAAEAAGADGALVLTADLPLIGPDDLDVIVGRASRAPSVVLVPSRDGTGTNAMLLRGPQVLEPQLGLGSLARHEAQAHHLGLEVVHHASAAVALDIDTPDDLAVLGAVAPEWIRTIGTGSPWIATGGVR